MTDTTLQSNRNTMKIGYFLRIVIIILTVIFCGAWTIFPAHAAAEEKETGYTRISQDEAKEMMERDDGHIIVDVRTQEEYDAGHIPGAVCIPNESIGSEQPEELPDPDQIILVYCRSGRRSKEASQKLADIGYSNIYEFGGIIDWTGDVVTEDSQAQGNHAKLLYMGHASIRITTGEGKVIYIDPFAGEGYDPAADLILITHDHYDHNAPDKVENRTPDCRIITWEDALEGGVHQSFDLDYVTVESVEAGCNAYHDISACTGYILTLADGVSVYVSGDTSRTEQMPLLADKDIDYAFFCCDGIYNMDVNEAAECASLVGAKHSIPYHVISADAGLFDRERAEQFDAPGCMIMEPGEEIELVKA